MNNYLVTVRTTLTTKAVFVDQFRIDSKNKSDAEMEAKNKAQYQYGIPYVTAQEIVSCVTMPSDW